MSHSNKYETLPIYIKAKLIYQLVESLITSIPENDDYLQDTKEFMRVDAMIIPAKIAGAEGGNLYSIRMQNAAIIREHAMHLNVQVGSLRFHETFKDIEYVDLIRKEIEAFRILFVEWIQNFDTTNYIWDEWELFNPPHALRPSNDLTFDEDFNFDDFLNDENEDDD
ncbi:hypothetical protein [Flavobacterium sp. UMI-01]|uniref:hypothetical protein n=1 Tax=Flavobacterium sp. UMI-01 TaxID=1441053 RepID=UPI001C7CEF84|nr:hypothetical protein [Flavobacterium sp. UMI-01]GIZ08227.1 hypothetical protein FUMI01_09540 [Flavobacterium sp. UMI-01]